MLRLLIAIFALVPAEMVAVPGGAFVMGSDAGELDERPAHRVELRPFFLDRDEVTVAEYRRCVAAGSCRAPRWPTEGPHADAEPVTWVSWRDAEAYCRFAGERLPTEAEWERAARGDDGRVYPWGDSPECERANFGNYRGEGRCPRNPGRPVEIGRFPTGASPFGARDLAGNVWEWVADRYAADYYARSPLRDPRGPAGDGDDQQDGDGLRREVGAPPAKSWRVVRGGGCCSMFGLPRASNRVAFPPDYVDEDLGFRCARDAETGSGKESQK